MKDRIKKIRRELGLTQQQFANKIGIKRNSVAKYETGDNVPSAASISLICARCNVNEAWLRTGEGEMFAPAPNDELDALAKKYNMNSTERTFFEEYLRLDDAERSAVSEFLRKVCKPTGPEAPADLPRLSIDEKVELYRQELEREEKVKERSEALQKDA